MTPRPHKETSDDEVQTKVQQAVHEVLDDKGSVKDRLLTETAKDALLPQDAKETAAVDTTVELDRTEAYLRGPTVFAA